MRITAAAALSAGGRQVLRIPKLIVLLYAVNLVVAACVIAPLVFLIHVRLGHSLENDREFLNLDPSWVMEGLYQFHYWPLNSLMVTLGCVAAIYLVLNTFLAGGAIAVFRREDDAFFSACARYFWRLFRLMLISMVFYGIVLSINNVLVSVIDQAKESSMQAHPWIILGWGRRLLAVILFGMVNMLFDYAKIAAIAGGRRSAIRSTLAALRFVTSHAGVTSAVYWGSAAVGLLFLLAYHLVSEALGQGTAITVVLLLGIRQVYMLTRIWGRLWTWSSELHLYEALTPAPAPVVQFEQLPYDAGYYTRQE